jgi:hypothetical protein
MAQCRQCPQADDGDDQAGEHPTVLGHHRADPEDQRRGSEPDRDARPHWPFDGKNAEVAGVAGNDTDHDGRYGHGADIADERHAAAGEEAEVGHNDGRNQSGRGHISPCQSHDCTSGHRATTISSRSPIDECRRSPGLRAKVTTV